MATDKPQFKVYLPPAMMQEIANHAEKHGMTNGKLVETVWNFFMLRDFHAMADKLQRWTEQNPYQPGRSPAGLVRMGAIITNWVNKK